MTSCTQPSCTGTIVDDYCDVCGSPAGAAPSAPADDVGLPIVRPGSASHPEPKSGTRSSTCTQPGCTGTILDGYCDLCGSPAGAVPFVPAAVEAPRIDGEKGFAEDEPGAANDYAMAVEKAQLPDEVRAAALREVGKLEQTSAEDPEFGDIRAWLDTILDLEWGTETSAWMDIEGSREVEATLRALIDPAAATTEEADAGTVESEASDIEDADAGTVDSEASDIEDADAATVDSEASDTEDADAATVDSEASDTEDADAATVDSEATDTENADAAKSAPVAAATANANSAAADSHHEDTVETPAVLAVPGGDRHPHPQLPEQLVVGPVPVQTPAPKRRVRSLTLAAAALVALLIGAVLVGASRDDSGKAVSTPTVTATATARATDTAAAKSNIQLEDVVDSARPFDTVRIQGTYRGGKDTFVRVQRKEGGEWVEFPLPSKTDESGRFTAYVELGLPGRYQLRVLDPASGVTSKTFVLVIKGP